ncbi:SDR family NAD(P)-dependent oxidoreductase, partial [Pseudoalteromonas sp. GAB2316C]|uniref:SDR family NAD(P)-dependent oxidoreductase n=1 Tax=Pseudoalteromonas sp. GAB2316C TaxID=3025326 RepID=UPI00235A33A1
LLKEALKRGATPIAVEFNPGAKDDLERLIGERGQVHIADVRHRDAMEKVAQAAINEFGGIDVVIANAGIECVGLTQDMPAEDFEAVVETNLLGVYRTIKPTLNSIAERGGHVLAVSSIGALLPFTFASAYGTSKSGVDMLMRILRMELSGVGATAGCAYFGFVQTPMANNLFSNPVVEKAVGRMPSRFVGLKP